MHRFISSAASSSCGRAEQAAAASSSCSSAEQPSTSLRSAEQPATPSQVQILSIRDVQRWLAVETVASCSSADMERIREAAAVLSRPKPGRGDVQPLQRQWQVTQKKDQKPIPLAEMLDEFRGKVIKAAQELQLKLLGVEDPCLPELERADEDPFLAELKRRQRKRAIKSESEEHRPFAKPKAAKRQNKRSAPATSGGAEQAASKRKDQHLTAELFQACARDPSEFQGCLLGELGATSSSSASLSEQQRKTRMTSRQ